MTGHGALQTVVEEEVEGYTTLITGSAADYTITNTHEPGKTNYSVKKNWNDNNNQDGFRPTEITVQLLADENAHGEAITLNAANGWEYTWTDLDEKAEGKEIVYSVAEVSVDEKYKVSYERRSIRETNN